MTGERTLKTELVRLLLEDCSPRGVSHLEGRIRGIFFALTGHDIGPRCGVYNSVLMMCVELGWGCTPYGESGWRIDWHGEADEAVLKEAGIELEDE